MPEFKTREKPKPIFEGREVKVTRTKHIVQVMDVARQCNNFSKIHKVDKYRYYIDDPEECGEVHYYKLNSNRGQNIAGIKDSMKRVRNLINNNFEGKPNELFVTTTYGFHFMCLKRKWITEEQFSAAEEKYKALKKKLSIAGILLRDGMITDEQLEQIELDMRDTEFLYRENKKFIKKVAYAYPDMDYISVVEPQGSGSWHTHTLMRFNDRETIFINNNKELQPMWGHGFTKIKRLGDVDNIGAYVSAYLADLEVTEENVEVLWNAHECNGKQYGEDENGNIVVVCDEHVRMEVVKRVVNGKEKRYMKNARLHLYPVGMNFYRCSRGIEVPEVTKETYGEIKKEIYLGEPDFSKTIDVMDSDGNRLNTITYENYNLKRIRKQLENQIQDEAL